MLESDREAPLLILFTAEERHAVAMLVEAHQRETQIGLAGVAFRIEVDQRPADAPTDPRGDARVSEGTPDHVPGNAKAVAIDKEGNFLRKNPEDTSEAPEQKRRLQEPDAEVRLELGYMASVLMDTLIGVGTHFA